MNSLIFKTLIIFSPVEELAKKVDLQPGLNVVTSRKKDGNDLGKSIIAKSFYHCLGADCRFDDKFDEINKIFVLVLEYENQEYTFYRSGSLFKMFDSGFNLLWSASHRHELGKQFYQQFGFAIWLPSRHSGETEITPPAYSFAPYFVDQNQYGGSDFKSFLSLDQYSGYKSDLIYTFTGAYDEAFFEIKAQKESLDAEIHDLQTSIDLNKAMGEQVFSELSALGYSADMTTLAMQCDEHESDYKKLAEVLGKYRSNLYELREKRAQTELALKGAEALGKHLDKGIGRFDGKSCPLCHNHIENPLSTRVSACIAHADALILGDELKRELDSIDRKIIRLENSYRQKLDKLDALKASMETLRASNMTVVQIEGLIRLDEKMAVERGHLEKQFDFLSRSLDVVLKRLRTYSEAKKDIDDRYIEIINESVFDLNLQSINMDKIKNLTSRFVAEGSNAPLATVAWYFALLMLKEEFNPGRVSLPLILDSPLNVEADDEKYELQYGLIFKKFRYRHQMVVTGLGLAGSSVVPKDANVIVLENRKYELLNKADYESAKDLVFTCMEQH